MIKNNIFLGLILALFSLVDLGGPAKALPKEGPPEPTTLSEEIAMPSAAEFQEQFYDYMFDQKHTLLLGIDRAACAYSIDPTDVYEQSGTRFVTAVVTGSDWGNGCGGHLAFQVIQADCETNTLYIIERETGNLRFDGWERREWTLYVDDHTPNIETSLDGIEQPPAEAICGLPLAGVSETEEASEPLSGN